MEELVLALELGDRDAVMQSLSLSFPSALRIRAKTALFRYALRTLDEKPLKRAAGLATRDSLMVEILPFLSTPLAASALKALAHKGPFKGTIPPQLAAAILQLLKSSDPNIAVQAVAAGVSLQMKELPERILSGSLKVSRKLVQDELQKLVRYWQPYDDKTVYKLILAANES